jgi:hypothetical protein
MKKEIIYKINEMMGMENIIIAITLKLLIKFFEIPIIDKILFGWADCSWTIPMLNPFKILSLMSGAM